MTLLLQNSLRLAVRSDGSKPEGVILSFAGVVNTQRYERRRSELAFVEDGVRIAAGEGVEGVELDGWPSLSDLVADADDQDTVAYPAATAPTGGESRPPTDSSTSCGGCPPRTFIFRFTHAASAVRVKA